MMTPSEFLTAATTGEEAAARAALEAQPVLAETVDGAGVPVALQALYHGRKALAEVLAEARRETISIFEAAALGRARDVAVLLQLSRDRAHALSPDGFTALHLAAFFGHHYCAKLLLDERADPNTVSQNPLGVTPLHAAVADKEEAVAEALVALLLNAGADPNARQPDGFTPLHTAQQNGHTRVERLLRAKGATEPVEALS